MFLVVPAQRRAAGFKIGPVKVPPVPPGVKFSFQVSWVNPSGLPIYSVSNGLLLSPGDLGSQARSHDR